MLLHELPAMDIVMKPAAKLLLLASLFTAPYGSQAYAEWADWWLTPEQQAKSALESDDVERLKSVAPDAAWQGVAEHEAGDFEAAAKTFNGTAQQQQIEGNSEAANRALFNQGVSEVRAGQYDNAVQTFDQVLEQDPQFTDAEHNRDIAQQLIEQQQQQEQERQEGEGEGEEDASPEEGEQQSSDDSGEPSDESQSADQEDSGEPAEPEQSDSDQEPGESDEDGDQEPDSQAQMDADEQAAQDALEAEAQAANQDDELTDAEAQEANAAPVEQPMSESDQATEQWLRRIPDDPAGLLRRKLEQSHRTEYPQVRQSGEPW